MAKKIPILPKLGYGQGTMVYREKSDIIQYQKIIKVTTKSGERIKERATVYGKNVNECFEKMKQAQQEIERKIHEKENPTLYDVMIMYIQ